MKQKQFEQELAEVIQECTSMLTKKGREYQATEIDGIEVFQNFINVGNTLGLNKEDVLFVYFEKHIHSISKFLMDLRSGKSLSEIENNMTEPINGRIVDAINYLLLLNSMINERRENENTIH